MTTQRIVRPSIAYDSEQWWMPLTDIEPLQSATLDFHAIAYGAVSYYSFRVPLRVGGWVDLNTQQFSNLLTCLQITCGDWWYSNCNLKVKSSILYLQAVCPWRFSDILTLHKLHCRKYHCIIVIIRVYVQCTRSCGGGLQLRSVSCVGGRACLPDVKPTEDQVCNTEPCGSTSLHDPHTDDQACNTGHCLSTVSQGLTGWSTSSDHPTPVSSTPGNNNRVSSATTTLGDDDDRILQRPTTTTTTNDVTTTATTKTSTAVANNIAVSQTTTTTITTTTTTAAAVTSTTTTGARRQRSSYRWMALFWDQVSFHFIFGI